MPCGRCSRPSARGFPASRPLCRGTGPGADAKGSEAVHTACADRAGARGTPGRHPAAHGLGACNSRTASELAAVLRSWEDRFGVRLLEVGFADIRLLVSRPPQTLEAAQPIAAEHFAFADGAHQGP